MCLDLSDLNINTAEAYSVYVSTKNRAPLNWAMSLRYELIRLKILDSSAKNADIKPNIQAHRNKPSCYALTAGHFSPGSVLQRSYIRAGELQHCDCVTRESAPSRYENVTIKLLPLLIYAPEAFFTFVHVSSGSPLGMW